MPRTETRGSGLTEHLVQVYDFGEWIQRAKSDPQFRRRALPTARQYLQDEISRIERRSKAIIKRSRRTLDIEKGYRIIPDSDLDYAQKMLSLIHVHREARRRLAKGSRRRVQDVDIACIATGKLFGLAVEAKWKFAHEPDAMAGQRTREGRKRGQPRATEARRIIGKERLRAVATAAEEVRRNAPHLANNDSAVARIIHRKRLVKNMEVRRIRFYLGLMASSKSKH